MLYDLLYPLADNDLFSPLRVFQYISFRAAGAAITALIISFLIGPKIIRTLSSLQIGETINTIGPKSHQIKKGTPTMGGIIILLSVILPTVLWADINNFYIQIVIIATIVMGIAGLIDDYLKVVKKYPRGLIARYKMIGQIFLGFIVGIIITNYSTVDLYSTSISVWTFLSQSKLHAFSIQLKFS